FPTKPVAATARGRCAFHFTGHSMALLADASGVTQIKSMILPRRPGQQRWPRGYQFQPVTPPAVIRTALSNMATGHLATHFGAQRQDIPFTRLLTQRVSP